MFFIYDLKIELLLRISRKKIKEKASRLKRRKLFSAIFFRPIYRTTAVLKGPVWAYPFPRVMLKC